MKINVRVNGVLAEKMGRTRFSLSLPPQAKIEDLVERLQRENPHLADEICRAVVMHGGAHQPAAAFLSDGQEIALLMPIAGG